MTKDEALKLALEALEYEAKKANDDAYRKEREAIKEALAQPEQEHFALKHRIAELEGAVIGLQAQLAQPEHEPVAWQLGTLHVIKKKIPKDADKSLWNPLYANPFHPKRLTDKQIEEIIKSNMLLQINFVGIRNDIEQAHGIKE